MPKVLFLPLVLLLGFWVQGEEKPASAGEFTVMVYNVENLFDIDRVSPYDDYLEDPTNPHSYGPTKLMRKLQGVISVLKGAPGGAGPDVVMLNELEVDHTPESKVTDLGEFLKKHANTTYQAMLTKELTEELRGIPIEAWLLKALEDEGLKGYTIVTGSSEAPGSQHEASVKSGLLTRFPVLASKTHPTPHARGILEVRVDVGGKPVTFLVSHWKSKAGDPVCENQRLANAETVRKRLDELLAANPFEDVILGGDFNSHYNQGQRYPYMTKTALQDVLGSQGLESAMRESGGPVLYNLWFEVPPEKRFSDAFAGNWGTLMQILITRGLYDGTGIQYVDNSFGQLVLPGINARPPLNEPWSWTNYGPGWGTSDHFPVLARFRPVPPGEEGQAVALKNPSDIKEIPAEALPVGLAKLDRNALRPATALQGASDEELAKAMGEVFRVSGVVTKKRPLEIEVGGKTYALYSFDENIRKVIQEFKKGDSVNVLGELGIFKGRLQFLVQDPTWLRDSAR